MNDTLDSIESDLERIRLWLFIASYLAGILTGVVVAGLFVGVL